MPSQNFINNHLNKLSIISILLYPLSLIYLMCISIRRLTYKLFPKLTYKSRIPIISIGNITTGGTGKTPFVIYLTKQLQQSQPPPAPSNLEGNLESTPTPPNLEGNYHIKVAIVLRGYKGELEDTNTLISDYNTVFDIATKAGDEALLYTQTLKNTPICVGKDRVKSIKLLEERFPDLDYIIMDDGLQYLKVFQDIKVCVINAFNPVGNSLCLPAGILREPISAIYNHDYILFNGCSVKQDTILQNKPDKDVKQDTILQNKTYKSVKQDIILQNKPDKDVKQDTILPNKPILYGNYKISTIYDTNNVLYETHHLSNKKILALSGIGNPLSFENTLKNAQISFLEHLSLPDHFRYTSEFLHALNRKYEGFDFIITTEKDFMKLKEFEIKVKLLVVAVEFEIINMDCLIASLLAITKEKIAEG